MAEVGDVVRICDEKRQWHNGLITAIHGWTTEEQRREHHAKQVASLEAEMASDKTEDWKATRVKPVLEAAKLMVQRIENGEWPFSPSCINAVFVTGDTSKSDPYGRQVERLSSLQHKSGTANMVGPGRYYVLDGEE